jgi:hypothetical protein
VEDSIHMSKQAVASRCTITYVLANAHNDITHQGQLSDPVLTGIRSEQHFPSGGMCVVAQT